MTGNAGYLTGKRNTDNAKQAKLGCNPKVAIVSRGAVYCQEKLALLCKSEQILELQGLGLQKLRARMSTALGSQNFDTASEFLEKNAAMRAIKGDDDKLWAGLRGKDEKGVRDALIARDKQTGSNRFSDPLDCADCSRAFGNPFMDLSG